MSADSLPGEVARPGADISVEIHLGRLDLIILGFMARKIAVTLHTLEQPVEMALPLSCSFEERRGRQHRIILLAPRELLALEELYFVGFVSKRNPTAEQRIVEAIFQADEGMLVEIAHISGLFSYSSLELHPGSWYNLVLFRDSSARAHVPRGELHRHAAYQLSPAYYEWVRLYNGWLAGGLSRPEWRLASIKHLRFFGADQPPVVHEFAL